MKKWHNTILECVLLAAVVAAGCKPANTAQEPPHAAAPMAKTSAPQAPASHNYFATQFQSEAQFVVEAIVTDLAEQVYYAAKHRLPDKDGSFVMAVETGGAIDAPTYNVHIKLNQKEFISKITVNAPIWSPEVYTNTAAELARAAGLGPAANPRRAAGTGLVSELTDGTALTIERENQAISDKLEMNFTNPQLHEQAALLLGAFVLRDHSGHFFEIRSPLSRLTAHLTMARFLRGGQSPDLNGQLAEAILLTMEEDQTLALQRLNSINSHDSDVTILIRTLQALNTGDFRALDKIRFRTRVESVAWFAAMSDYADASVAWWKLNPEQRIIIDFVRTANQKGYSVETGHELLRVSIPLELREEESIHQLSRGRKLDQTNLVAELNVAPERCFTTGPDGKSHVRIIGWGQWANFLQRHLCHAVQQNFYFMQWHWGVPDEAKKFAAGSDRLFGGLYLYPFVRRFNSTDSPTYRKALDDGFLVTITKPQLVPADCWDYLCYKADFAPLYCPVYSPHLDEWHNHDPLPGTVYDFAARMHQFSLAHRPDVFARFEQLHEMAPYDDRVSYYLINKKYHDHPTYEQALALYKDVLPWSVYAIRTVAKTVTDDPIRYEELMLDAAKWDPSVYYDLGDYFDGQRQEDKAAQYYDRACDNDADSVRVSNHSIWRVRHYLKAGQWNKAAQIADAGAEVYSHRGLEAKAIFMEATSNYNSAFQWYSKINERYDDIKPLLLFCERYKQKTGDSHYDAELQRHIVHLFPNGQEKVSDDAFHGPPNDGVLVNGNSDSLRQAQIKKGDVIVALNGIRVHSMPQYLYVRNSMENHDLNLIVWQWDGFHSITANPPEHRFGVDFDTYRRQ